MASDKTPDKSANKSADQPAAPPPRRVWSPTAVAALLPAIMRPALKGRAPGVAQLLPEWQAIVGPRLAGLTTPRRLTGGTLTLACAATVAMELQHAAAPLIQRINAHAGRILVERLRFVPTPTATPEPAATRREPSPAARARVAARVAEVADDALRDALTRLGEAVAARADPPGESPISPGPISPDSNRHA